MNLIIMLSWVLWAVSIYDRRSRNPRYLDKWHQDFCRRQRRKAGSTSKNLKPAGR